jgi:hypothetical protein
MSTSDRDRYQLVRRNGTTAFGPSYEAIHPRRPGRFLVEVLASLRGDGERKAAFERDVGAVASLRHPYIAQTFEIDALPDGTPIIVSELSEGETLESWLANGHVPTRDAVASLMTALGSALHAVHARGVSHGDVGAHTVWLLRGPSSEMGLPKWLGFGARCVRDGARAPASSRASDPDSRAADLAALSRLGERLLQVDMDTDDPTVANFFLPPATKDVLARAQAPRDVEPFESPAAFAAAFAASLDESPPLAAAADPRAGAGGSGLRPRRWVARVGWVAFAASAAVGLAAWGPASARAEVRRWLSSVRASFGDGANVTRAVVTPQSPFAVPVPLFASTLPPEPSPMTTKVDDQGGTPPASAHRNRKPTWVGRRERRAPPPPARPEPSVAPDVVLPTVEQPATEEATRPRSDIAEGPRVGRDVREEGLPSHIDEVGPR